MNYTITGFLGLLLAPGSAFAAPPDGWGHAPTRLQWCQQEVKDASGEQRKRQLRDCLARRMEGEQAVASECQHQLRLPAKRSALQQKQLNECEARALALPSSQLPRRPTAAAAPAQPARPPTSAPASTAPARTPLPLPAAPPPPSSNREGA